MRVPAAAVGACVALLVAGCHDPMSDRGRVKPLEPAPFFADELSARPLVPGTIPRGTLEADSWVGSGRVDGKFVSAFPEPLSDAILARGRERYEIFCAPCHDRAGYGRGTIVERGFKQPASFHEARLLDAPAGYFVDVIESGFGVMAAYRKQVGASDRWAITAWIRALQLSQRAPESRLSAEERRLLSEGRR